MSTLKPEVVKNLIGIRELQLLHVEVYENNKQYETAYLALWSILEKFVKTVAYEYRREMLRSSLAEWTDYLDGKQEKRPESAPKCILDAITLPKKNEFFACLNYFGFIAEKVWAVMDSQGRFRLRRNDIAHNAKRFGNKANYQEMEKIMSGLIASIYGQLGVRK